MNYRSRVRRALFRALITPSPLNHRARRTISQYYSKLRRYFLFSFFTLLAATNTRTPVNSSPKCDRLVHTCLDIFSSLK